MDDARESVPTSPRPPWSDRLIEYVRGLSAEVQRDGDDLLIRGYRTRSFDPPARLGIEENGLRAYLESMMADAQVVFPDVPAAVGAYRLLLTHVDEILETKLGAGVSVKFVPGGAFAVTGGIGDKASQRDAPDPDLGPYAWRAGRSSADERPAQ
jgi:hypothetical protein